METIEKLYFLGPKGTYSEVASEKIKDILNFKSETVEVSTITKIAQLVNQNPLTMAIMPIEKAYHLTDVVALLKHYDWQHQRRVSFEYICWGGVNDTPKHANELLRLLRGLDCRVNLIRFHAGVEEVSNGADAPQTVVNQNNKPIVFPPSNERQMEWLRDYLTAHGLTTTIRRSRGEDILAACGMLVNALKNK